MLPTVVMLAMLGLSFACAIVTPTQPTEPTVVLLLKFDQDLDLVKGQEARLDEGAIAVKLVDAHGGRSGCPDCPVGATLDVRSGAETTSLQYSFSGGMQPELLERAKRKTAFNMVFVAVRVSDAGLTLRVERPK